MDKKTLVSLFFTYVDKHFKYAILHHVEEVFSDNKDIDFVIDCNNKNELLDLIRSFLNENHYVHLFNFYPIDRNNYRIDLVYINNIIAVLELDICIINNRKDLLSTNTLDILNNRVLIKCNNGQKLYCSNPEDEIFHYIKKKALKKQKIIKHIDYFMKLTPTLKKTEILEIYKNQKKYYNSFQFKIKFSLNKAWLLFNRIANKSMFSISILGPDGSGKSTIINLLKKTKLPFRETMYFHLKPIKSQGVKAQINNPHGKPNYNAFISNIKLVYLFFQYNFGWLVNILPLKIKSSLVIFDRYYDDLFVDAKRYRFAGSVMIAQWIRKLIPKPYIYFVLTASSELIYDRKKEVPFHELENQIKGYNDLSCNDNFYILDASKSPDNICYEIICIITKHISKRYS